MMTANQPPPARSDGDALASALSSISGRCSHEADRATIIKAANALRATSPACDAAEGWLIVPKEPTQDMVRAAYLEQQDTIKAGFAQAYRAMISVAPTPPKKKPALDAVQEALRWYGEQARLARLIHSEGDAGRNALSADGGKRAQAALATSPVRGDQEPTPSMRIAGGIAWAEASKTAETFVDCADACWKAMWDAR